MTNKLMKRLEIIKEKLQSPCMNELTMEKRKRAQKKLYLYPPPQIQKPANISEIATSPNTIR